jgi:hypothetical protein
MAYQPPLNGRRINIKADSNSVIDNGTVTLASGSNVTLSQASSTITIASSVANDSVTNAKLANMAVNTIKGRITSGTGDPEDLTATNVGTIIGYRRMGLSLRRATNQSIGNAGGSDTAISWDTEDADTDGFFAPTGTTITVPSGCGGVYSINFYTTWGTALGTGRAFLTITHNGIANYRLPLQGQSETLVSCAFVVPLSATDTIVAKVYQSSGGANNVQAQLLMYRVSL